MKLATRGISILAFLSLAATALAQAAATPATPAPAKLKKPVYVQDFTGSYQPPSQGHTSMPE